MVSAFAYFFYVIKTKELSKLIKKTLKETYQETREDLN